MASNSLPAPLDRPVVDDLPERIGVLPGEVDLLCQYLADTLTAMLVDPDVRGCDLETWNERLD